MHLEAGHLLSRPPLSAVSQGPPKMRSPCRLKTLLLLCSEALLSAVGEPEVTMSDSSSSVSKFLALSFINFPNFSGWRNLTYKMKTLSPSQNCLHGNNSMRCNALAQSVSCGCCTDVRSTGCWESPDLRGTQQASSGKRMLNLLHVDVQMKTNERLLSLHDTQYTN